MSVTYLDPHRIARVHVTDDPTYGRTATGYGRKLPTCYMLTLDDRRKRRVYAMSYGNTATLYVVVGGVDHVLESDAESMVEYERVERQNDDPLTFDASDAGCLVDGSYGWHAHAAVIDLAVTAGMPFYYYDRIALDSYRTSNDGNDDPAVLDHILDSGGLLDRAEQWLNDYAAPEGHTFEWHDGEFFLAPTDEAWVN